MYWNQLWLWIFLFYRIGEMSNSTTNQTNTDECHRYAFNKYVYGNIRRVTYQIKCHTIAFVSLWVLGIDVYVCVYAACDFGWNGIKCVSIHIGVCMQSPLSVAYRNEFCECERIHTITTSWPKNRFDNKLNEKKSCLFLTFICIILLAVSQRLLLFSIRWKYICAFHVCVGVCTV